jgi:hypothetical protein
VFFASQLQLHFDAACMYMQGISLSCSYICPISIESRMDGWSDGWSDGVIDIVLLKLTCSPRAELC